MHVILTGATGLVGSACLNQMLSTNGISKISILSRKPVPMAEGKPNVDVIIHRDFVKYDDDVLERLKGAEGCVWALGVSVTDVSKEEYNKITIDYPIAAAKAFSSLSDPFKFIYVSGEGATTTPGTFTPHFGKIKGQAESALLDLSKSNPSLKPYSVRPGFVDSKNDPAILPFTSGRKSFMKHSVEVVLGPVFRAALPSQCSPTQQLGKVIAELAMSEGKPLEGSGVSGEGRTIANVGLRRLAGL